MGGDDRKTLDPRFREGDGRVLVPAKKRVTEGRVIPAKAGIQGPLP